MKRRLGTGLVAFTTVFSAFCAYAYLAPTSYRATALVVAEGSEPTSGRDDATLALELEHALLDPETRASLTAALGDDAEKLAPHAALRRLRSALEIESWGGRSFVISYTDGSPDQAVRLADLLTRKALEKLPALLGADPNAARARAAEELSAFIQQHPELTVEPPLVAQSGDQKSDLRDRTLSVLKDERSRLVRRLAELAKNIPPAELEGPTPSTLLRLEDNPARLRRRIAEIDAALGGPRLSLAANTPPALPLSTADRAELARLVENLDRSFQAVPGAEIRARVITPAQRPSEPISPPRGLLLGIGALLGVFAGLGAACFPRQRRSARPATPESPAPQSKRWPQEQPQKGGALLPFPRDPRREAAPLSRRPEIATPILPPIRGARIIEVAEPRVESAPRAEAERRAPAEQPPPRLEATRPVVVGSVQPLPTRDTIPFEFVAEPVPAPPTEPSVGHSHIVTYSELADQGALITPYDVPVGWHPDSALQVERLRGLAHALYPLAAERPFVLAVTSTPSAVADKSRTAAELALALAEFAHRRVLLLEGNFTRPSLQRWMRLRVPSAYGFTRQLQAYAERRLYGGWKVARCTQWLDVCAEGAVRTPGAMLGAEFIGALRELERHYGFIVIDGPPIDAVSDCRALDQSLEGVVVVRKRGAKLPEARLSSLFTAKRFSTVIDSAA